MDDVQQVRQAATWIAGNASLFNDEVSLPYVTNLDDDAIRRWISDAELNNVGYEQLRDATLINFQDEDDLRMFMRVMRSMNIWPCVALHGQEYIANNAYTL